MTYDQVSLKQPQESIDYAQNSNFIIDQINQIMNEAMMTGNNKIVINTNLALGIPMENVNKIAGPFVEAWAVEIFTNYLANKVSPSLKNVTPGERLNMADVILEFNLETGKSIFGYVDVKATSKDIEGSGKSPNITSYARIRSAYVQNPNFNFIILSIKHRVYSKKDPLTNMMMGIMEVMEFKAYDLKFIAENDISYNPALGTGQLQIKDIHHVNHKFRTTWEFCQILDRKFLSSKKGFDQWYEYALQNNWTNE
ncbi:hypothetical protein ACO0K3_18565 [Undibacterium sp. Rencai35W]|uniref:hypothetical protein n=1 Tax=Undibacterium sp. Rencai35W TaxID=3413046 RepID=UPI003BF34A61